MSKIGEDVISPEGLEECVKQLSTYEIMLTQGGKYRIYAINDDRRVPMTIHDIIEAAQKKTANFMAIVELMVLNPQLTMDILLKHMEENQHGPATDQD